MSRSTISLLVILGIVVFFGIGSCASALSWRGEAVNHEASIKAQYKDNQNTYDSMWKRIKESAQVPAMYASDLKKLYDGAISSRYGAGGSKAMFQFIKEHNPNLDSSIYKQLQRTIEAGRKEFAAGQTILLDKKRVYESHLRSNTGVIWAGVLGYPTIDLDKFDIVTSGRTQDAFRSGRDDKELKLR